MTIQPQWLFWGFLLMMFMADMNRDGIGEALKNYLFGLPVLTLIAASLMSLLGYEELVANFFGWLFIT